MPNRTLKIAVISDTHNYIPDGLIPQLEQADEIWHLGDVCRPETLNVLEKLPTELSVVQGNCDPYFHWEESFILERNGLQFKLQHLPPQSTSDRYTAILFGHLHYPIREVIGATTTLNPGAITGPRNGSLASFAWLNISSESEWSWEIQSL